MNEESLIQEKFGKEQPFRVPEGYFEHFADKLMEQLPDEGAKVVEMRPRKYWKVAVGLAAAACFCAVLFSVGRLWTDSSDESLSGTATLMQAQNSNDGYDLEDMADYAMIDVGDMYCYVSDNQ